MSTSLEHKAAPEDNPEDNPEEPEFEPEFRPNCWCVRPGFENPPLNSIPASVDPLLSIGPYGETCLHNAVQAFDVQEVQRILSNHIVPPDMTDAYDNSPLYYIASCPSPDGMTEAKAKETRIKMTELLLHAGASMWTQGGFSGMRVFEAAEHYGHLDVTNILLNGPLLRMWYLIREHVNHVDMVDPLQALVDTYRELTWRTYTIRWLGLKSRRNENLYLHPEILKTFMEEPTSMHVHLTKLGELSAKFSRLLHGKFTPVIDKYIQTGDGRDDQDDQDEE